MTCSTLKKALTIFICAAIGATLGYSQSVVPLKISQLAPSVYLLAGKGGNILFNTGIDGTIMVDSQLFELAPAIEKAILDTTKTPIKYLINTHWYPDHTGGNAYFGKSAQIIAQSNVEEKLSHDLKIKLFNLEQKAAPASALPVITFESAMALRYNNDHIRLLYFSPTNMDGTTIVFFEGAKIWHIGDLYMAGSFPLIDVDAGGSASSLVAALERIMQLMPPDAIIVPSRGAPLNRAALEQYLTMLKETSAYIRDLKKSQLPLEKILQKGLPSKWQNYSKGLIKDQEWIKLLYASEKA